MTRSPLDRERIVAVALDLLDEVGLDGLSTRVLADRLGVRSPALYWHFKNKSELVAAMAETMSLQLPADVTISPPVRTSSRAAVARTMVERSQAFRRVLLSRRDGARVHAGSRPPTSRLGTIETQIDLLTRIGVGPADAARATLALSRFVVGWVLEEQQSDQQPEHLPDLSGYPGLSAAQALLAASDPDANFDACLDAIVNGLIARAIPAAREPRAGATGRRRRDGPDRPA